MHRHEYQDNPGQANWQGMEKKRDLFDGDVEEEINFGTVKVAKKQDPKTGKFTYNFSGGPYIRILGKDGGKFTYVTKEGNRIPFTKASLFTFTSKMSCPSFSIPAGPTTNGTCPASKPQSIEAEGSYTQHSPALSEMPMGETFICDVCYAGKNNYLMYPGVSLGQMAKKKWVTKAMRSGNFADLMADAIDMLLDTRIEDVLKAHLVSNRFFRIHDSGDFYTGEYYEAWVQICKEFLGKLGGGTGPLIYFWAPTRMWVYQKNLGIMQRSAPPANLAVRPSTLFTSAPPPMIPGLAAGSTSVQGRAPEPIWNCPAYEGAEEASCAGTRCRVCWTMKKRPVNYMTH